MLKVSIGAFVCHTLHNISQREFTGILKYSPMKVSYSRNYLFKV